jgi:transcriptional regulator with XRE-family HTH domain
LAVDESGALACNAFVQKATRGLRQLEAFGERLRAQRLKRQLSQEDLAELAGLHRTYVGHLERGEVNPTLINVLKVAAALQIDASVLLKGLAGELQDPRTV